MVAGAYPLGPSVINQGNIVNYLAGHCSNVGAKSTMAIDGRVITQPYSLDPLVRLYPLATVARGSGTGNFGWPLVGIGEKFQSLIQAGLTGNNIYEAYLWLLFLLSLALLIWLTLPRRQSNRTLAYGGWLYGGLLLVASFYILNYYLNYSRVFLDLFLLTILAMAPTSKLIRWPYLAISGLGTVTFLLLKS